ncbi:MAG: TetR/AcrR family transcriptional regulator [Gammaproteobacteria bacterium]
MSAPLDLPKTGKRELQKEARRTAIIDAALEAFTQQGFTATKLDDVAERAGIGKGTIYLYFDSKENLFEEVVRQTLFPMRDAAEARVGSFTGSAAELLTLHFSHFYVAMANPKIPPLMAMISGEALRFPAIARFFYEEIISKSQQILRRIISRGVESGEFRAEANELYLQLLTAPVLISTTWNLQFREHAPIEIDKYMQMHIDFVLRAIKA